MICYFHSTQRQSDGILPDFNHHHKLICGQTQVHLNPISVCGCLSQCNPAIHKELQVGIHAIIRILLVSEGQIVFSYQTYHWMSMDKSAYWWERTTQWQREAGEVLAKACRATIGTYAGTQSLFLLHGMVESGLDNR